MLICYLQNVCQDLKQYSELSCSLTSLIEVTATNFRGDHEDSEKKLKRKSIFRTVVLFLKEETLIFYFK